MHIFFKLLLIIITSTILFFFFFNDPATTEIYTLSLHDALPISEYKSRKSSRRPRERCHQRPRRMNDRQMPPVLDRKSTRLNSSHTVISYAVFCLKKKKKKKKTTVYNRTQQKIQHSAR